MAKPPEKQTSRTTAAKAYREAERRIKNAASGGDTLSLNIRHLKSIPESISALKELRLLSLMNTEVFDLSPISSLASLQSLDLDGSQVVDLTPIAGLERLESLDVMNTSISDLSPITGLTALQTLHLASTQVSDLSPIASLSALQSLDLMDTKVSDLAPIAGLKMLRSLDIDGSQVVDLTPVIGLNELQEFDLRRTDIVDFSPISHLTAIKSIHLTSTEISDLTPLSGLKSLQSLYIMHTRINDLTPLSNLNTLTTLVISNTEIIDLTPISNISGLESLDVSNTDITDLAPIVGLSGLKSLNIAHTSVFDLTPIGRLEGLQSLNIESTKVLDLAPIAHLSELKSLNIADTNISNLSQVSNIDTLEILNAANTHVSDLTYITTLGALQSLDLSNTNVTNFAPLATMTGLSTGALHWRMTGVLWPQKIEDPNLKNLSQLENPDSTILGINYLRRLQNLPPFWPEDYTGERELPELHSTEPPIVETIAETQLDHLPGQIPAPAIFVADGVGPIRLAPEPVAPYDPEQAELHEELLEAASHLRATIAERSGRTDRLIALTVDVEAFVEALGGGLQAMRPRRLWMRGNALRRIYDADLRARVSEDPDDAPLPEWTAARLEVVVLGYNAFAAGDPTLNDLDQRSLGPLDRSQLGPSLDAGAAIAQASREAPDVMAPDAAKLLEENAALARVAAGNYGPNADRLLTASLSAMRNAGAAIMRQLVLTARLIGEEGYKRWDQFATGLAGEAGKSAGKTAGPALLVFVAAQSGTISTLLSGVQGSAVVERLLTLVRQILGGT
jgi:Leucine-rich repeat (LRR) protein